MKIISIILILLNLELGSQDSILPKNEAGLVQFEGLVEIENIGKEALFNNAVRYASSVKKENKKKKDITVHHEKYTVEKKGSFFVYTQGLITPQIHGEITYNINIEVFANSYKYTFTNFVFNYYQRNRYGRYSPVSGKFKNLEEEKFAGMQKTWTSHKKTTKDYVEAQILKLKNKMTEIPPGAKTVQNFKPATN